MFKGHWPGPEITSDLLGNSILVFNDTPGNSGWEISKINELIMEGFHHITTCL
jgi:hypothetical protein